MVTQGVKGSIGLRIVVDCDTDISTATTMTIHYKKPGGTSGTFAGTLGTSDTTIDGVTYEANTYMYYITTSVDDLDEVSDWSFQGYVEMTGFSGFGSDLDRKPWANVKIKDHL